MENVLISYSLDILLVVVLAVTVLSSMRKGFLKCILSLICVVAAIAVAMTFSQPAAEWCYDNVLSGYIVSTVENAIEDGLDSASAATAVNQVVDEIPDFLVTQLSGFGIDINSVADEISSLKLSAQDTAGMISDSIIRPGVLVLLKMICFILIYLFVRFLLGFISGFINGVAKLPLLKQVNKGLGALIGAVKGVAIVFLICTVLNSIPLDFFEPPLIAQAVDNSFICNFVQNTDISALTEIDLYSITE